MLEISQSKGEDSEELASDDWMSVASVIFDAFAFRKLVRIDRKLAKSDELAFSSKRKALASGLKLKDF